MSTKNQAVQTRKFAVSVLLLVGLLLPTGSALAQTPTLPSGSFAKHLPANGVTSKNPTAAANITSLADSNLLQDPSFEAYTPNPYWEEYSTNVGTPLCKVTDCGNGGGTAGPRTGSAWAWFGGVNFTDPNKVSPEIGDVYQNVTFPSCGATLQFYLWIGAAQTGSDVNDILVARVDGTAVFSANATQIGSYPTYTLVSVDVSAYANGAAHDVEFYSNISGQYVNFNLDDVLVSGTCPTISGNAGAAGATLSYTDGTPKTATSLGNGSYSLPVSNNWSGTVTPSHTCFTFNPTSRNYSNVTTNQTAQNYTPTFIPASGCANIDVSIAGTNQGTYGIPSQGSLRVNYAGIDNGPVQVVSTNALPIVAGLRELFSVNSLATSSFQMMGLPSSQLSDTYWFPAYNNVTLNEQVRFGNVDVVDTNVTVTIGATSYGPYLLHPNEQLRVNYAGVDSGPVKVQSSGGVKIIAAIRDAWLVNGAVESFSQLMGLPDSQLSDTYWFPAYNNVTLNEQLRFANVGVADTNVTVTIGATSFGPYLLHPNEQFRINYPGVDSGPVKVKSSGGVKIIAAIREAYTQNGTIQSWIQLMGLPAPQLSDTYYFPAYDNVSLNGQLRFGNVDTTNTTVTVTIGGVVKGSYPLTPNQQLRVNYAGLDSGPVVIKSSGGVKIIAALRDALTVNGIVESFAQMMGLPGTQLSDTYLLPAYNNVTLDEQLRFGAP